jgi:hypothetical protein
VLAAVAARWEWGGDAGVSTTRRGHNHVRAWKTEGGSGDAPPRTPSRKGSEACCATLVRSFSKKCRLIGRGHERRIGRHPQVCVRAQRGGPSPSTTIVDPNGKTVAQRVCSGGAGVVQVGADRGGEVEVCVVLYSSLANGQTAFEGISLLRLRFQKLAPRTPNPVITRWGAGHV